MIAERNVTIEECPVQMVECRVSISGVGAEKVGEKENTAAS